jgi:endonuclease G, mitochondrial
VPRRKQQTSLLTLLIVIALTLAWAAYKKYYRDGGTGEKGGRSTGPAPRVPTAPRPPGSAADNLLAGNPSGAAADTASPDNYLIERPEYALSYNRSRGTPNWVAWHLTRSSLGDIERQNDFRPDDVLPTGWYRVTPSDYTGSGFDRGHMTPSADRSSDARANSATFLMSNMVPQAPDNNQGPWKQLEEYERTLAAQGNELYIVAGPIGTGGVGSKGAASTTPNGKVTVPAQTWKVILVLPERGDIAHTAGDARAIAVVMPNRQGIKNQDWRSFRVSIDEVERLTGYDFFSSAPTQAQAQFEAKVDDK